ncbi:hypothetical protein [Duganella vulcania]|uniref:Uncharacterized protein n=1 Tax=Duganella vulcania TaxID=2692166 RepID=A0A845GGS0_9BURK|nr:hypothetical protein [Duganella vulcania]MYM92456.1 hypothetical protein [Duganella vulcania]
METVDVFRLVSMAFLAVVAALRVCVGKQPNGSLLVSVCLCVAIVASIAQWPRVSLLAQTSGLLIAGILVTAEFVFKRSLKRPGPQ